MNIETAKEITGLVCRSQPKMIEAIKLLRVESAMGLISAKYYLEDHTSEDQLFRKLCDDFVQNKEDLLNVAKDDLCRLQLYIESLEAEIAYEKELEKKHA